MNQLPVDLAEPLHLWNPYPYGKVLFWLAAVALATLVWAWRRRSRRRAAEVAVPRAAPAPPPAPAASGIWSVINQIRKRYQDRDPRQGCHALSEALRSYYEKASRKPLSTLTAREIAAVVGDSAVAAFFELLAELQFRRRAPSRDELRGICNLAAETAARSEKR